MTHRIEDGVEKITLDQVLSGGLGSSSEERILDWTERSVEDKLYGAMLAKTRRSQVQDIEKDYLKNGWVDDGKGVVETHAKSDTTKNKYVWTVQTVRLISRDEYMSLTTALMLFRPLVWRKLRSTETRSGGIQGISSLLAPTTRRSSLVLCMITVSPRLYL